MPWRMCPFCNGWSYSAANSPKGGWRCPYCHRYLSKGAKVKGDSKNATVILISPGLHRKRKRKRFWPETSKSKLVPIENHAGAGGAEDLHQADT